MARCHAASSRVTARTGCEAAAMRWLILLLIFALVFKGLRSWLRVLGLGDLPGDFTIRLFGRELYLPLASIVVLSFVIMLLGSLV